MLRTSIFVRGQNESQRSTQNIVRSQQSSHYISLKFSVKSVKVKAKFQRKCPQLSDPCNAAIKNFLVKILTADEDRSTQYTLVPPPCNNSTTDKDYDAELT